MSKTGASTQLYHKVDVDRATHIKAKNYNEFFAIRDGLVIKKVAMKDGKPVLGEDGKPVLEASHYSEMVDGGIFFAFIDGEELELDGGLYAHLAFMAKDEKGQGTHLRCDGDKAPYVRRAEVQVPAYRKVQLHKGQAAVEIIQGEYYAFEEILEVDGKIIKLPNDNAVKAADGKWYYNDGTENHVASYSKKRIKIDHVLLDGGRIVDIHQLQLDGDEYIIKGVDGEDISVGAKDTSLAAPFIEGTSVVGEQLILQPGKTSQDRQRSKLASGTAIVYRWDEKHAGPDGLIRVEINASRTRAALTYIDENGNTRQEVYAEPGIEPNKWNGTNVKRHPISKLDIQDLGGAGVGLTLFRRQKDVAQDVRFNENTGEIVAYKINDSQITDIKWREVDGYKEIESYTINGVTISDIELSAGEVRRCKVHTVDENGEARVVEVADLKTSRYRELGITCIQHERLEGLKEKDGKLSFKLGDYQITDAEINPDGTIGICTIKYDGKQQQMDLSKDDRFRQLRVVPSIYVNPSFALLQHSKLIEKKDGHYQLVADVAQIGAEQDGVAPAKALAGLEDAIKTQEEYAALKSKYPTWVIDEKGVAHPLTDFDTTYTGLSNFDHKLDPMVNILGKTKYDVKKGEVQPNFESVEAKVNALAFVGVACCGNPVTLPLAFVVLPTAVVAWTATKTVKMIAKYRIQNMKAESVVHKTQKEAAKTCQRNINKIVRRAKRDIRKLKRNYSSAELDTKMRELEEQTRLRYIKEVGRLQVLGNGSFRCFFDMSNKKGKLKPENLLAYLTGLKTQKELRYGKPDKVEYKRELRKLKEQKLPREEFLIKKVALMKELGGRDTQYRAHRIQKRHIKLFLNHHNQSLEPDAQTSKADYKKIIRLDRDERLKVVGGLEDKMTIFKRYLTNVTGKSRRKVIADKRSSLEKEIKNVNITSVEYNEYVDRNGEPQLGNYTRDAMSYWDLEVSSMFEGNNPTPKHGFKYGYYDGLSSDQKANRPTELTDHTEPMVSSSDMRRLSHDKGKMEAYVSEVNKDIQTLVSENDAEIERINRSTTDSYESKFIRSIKLRELAAKTQKRSEQIKRDALSKAPNPELAASQLGAMVSAPGCPLDAESVRMLSQAKMGDRETQDEQSVRDYTAQTVEWAMQELKATNPQEFEQINSGGKDAASSQQLSILTVKHNISDKIAAEVLCEQKAAEFDAFCTNNSHLDPTSKEAMYAFYAEYRSSARSTDFQHMLQNPDFQKRFEELAIEKLSNGELTEHDTLEEQAQLTPMETEQTERVAEEVIEKIEDNVDEVVSPAPVEEEEELEEEHEELAPETSEVTVEPVEEIEVVEGEHVEQLEDTVDDVYVPQNDEQFDSVQPIQEEYQGEYPEEYAQATQIYQDFTQQMGQADSVLGNSDRIIERETAQPTVKPEARIKVNKGNIISTSRNIGWADERSNNQRFRR